MKITGNYLIIHTDKNAPEQRVTAQDENGRTLFSLQIRKSAAGLPFYLNTERLRGRDISFFANGAPFAFDGETDAPPPCETKEQTFRPQWHYTVPRGWLNDPNGLYFDGRKYHIFCQHNPLGTAWGNMHWHHSTTKDFLHFEHLGDALFPDEAGTMFSGSAIKDIENVSGLGNGAWLLFYTIADYGAPGRKPLFSQGLAFSRDGVHFEKYANNPVVPNLCGENRDPKVVFVPECKAYVMALYLEGDTYCLLKSADLLHWEEWQRLRLQNDAECPDLYYIKDSGKWIFAGASDTYLVGHFEESGFVAGQAARRFFRPLDGNNSYAAQSFSGADGRALRMTWENLDPERGQCFCGQLSVPTEMTLAPMKDGTLRLKAALCREMESRLHPVQSGGAGIYKINGAFLADFDFHEAFSVDVDGTALEIDTEKNRIVLGENSIPLTFSGALTLRLIIDAMSVELFADGGLIFSCVKALCGKRERTLTVTGNAAVTIKQ